MARRGLHHLDLAVSSLEQSLPLHRELLAPLGDTHAASIVGERGEEVWYLDGEGVGASLSLREAQTPSEGPYDRYAVGLHHLAFEAESRDVADERLAWARSRIPGYYAGFFHDPDGIKLEVVYGP